MIKIDIYRSFEQWKNGNVLEHGVPRTEYYSEQELSLVEMGWNYGYDAGRAVEPAQQEPVATLYGTLPVYDKPAQQDIPDLIAGALGVSRGTAYDMMREALAEASPPDPCCWPGTSCDAQQEPVAWIYSQGKSKVVSMNRVPGVRATPLYTSPQAQPAREWVGLTDEDKEFIAKRASVYDWHDYKVIEATEAKLKEKNT